MRLTLENLLDRSANTRVDVFVDNKALVSSWENQVSKSPEVSGVMKSIFQFSLARNLSLSFQYVPSQSNPADSPSRTLSDLDASLDSQPWKLVESTFGPHSIDLMALPSNVKLGRSGRPLKFFSPFPCVQAQGTNVFSQVLSPNENAYVFPPFTLIGPLLRYLASQPCPFTVVAPDVSPRRYCGLSSSVKLPLHSNWAEREIIQSFYSPLKLAAQLGNADHFSRIFGYFVSLLFYNSFLLSSSISRDAIYFPSLVLI